MSGAAAILGRFARSERGNVTLVFGLSIIVLALTSGLAIDGSRVYSVSSRLGAAIDAAALAAAKSFRESSLTAAETKAVARQYFDSIVGSSFEDEFTSITKFDVNVDPRQGAVEIKTEARVKMLFGGLAGYASMRVPQTAVALVYGKDIEIGAQLDITGSMAGQRIADLKEAVRDLIDIVIPDEPGPQRVRLGLAPYAAGVNAGRFATAVNGGRTGSANRCVYERRDSELQDTDVAPVGTAALKVRSDLASAQACPTAEVIEMLGDRSGDKTKLLNAVNTFAASGSTAGHLGTAWAAYLVSPNWNNVWGLSTPIAPYNDGKTLKFMILMTDGEYNTIGGVQKASNVEPSGRFAMDTCAEMKNKGVAIYTIGFTITAGSPADEVLRQCATNRDMYFKPQTGGDLSYVFRQIAQDIVSLRLTK